ncbi:gliding motility protein GldC [Arachidicoccus sp.]|jgi:gliding motility-associated protein GldC|uniref:gliding motility protein GldC n=1 Tax=Arachidicoccus sp. TaxID=1872624 RepID=UPI003D249893
MAKSNIQIEVNLDDDKIPESIFWNASDGGDESQKARAMMLAFWDGADKSALRVDLWTKEMMVDEMADFFYQTFMTMGDTFKRATNQPELVDDIKNFAKAFYQKFRETQLKENKIEGKV